MDGGDCRLAVVAGFRADLLDAVGAHGVAVTLEDASPFTERFDELDADDLALLAAELGLPGDIGSVFADAEPRVLGGCAVRTLSRGLIERLAAHDDTRVRPLLDRFLLRLGRDPEPSGRLADGFRGLVVQARAAVLNGWVVLAVQPVS